MTPSDEAIRGAILDLLTRRRTGKTICPSDAARVLAADWRGLMPDVRRVATVMAEAGEITVTQRGAVVDVATVKGPVRLGLPVP
jgi:hypothetical protein